MSENKFIQHLKGKATAGSVVEIKNQATPASFANMPSGTSNSNNVYADVRGNATVVAQGTTNWKLDSANLVLASNVSGDGNDYTGVYGASGAGLWVNATYTFPSTGDPNHPVAMIFNPNTKWVLKLCGDNLLANGENTIDFSLVITIGSGNIITKNFTVAEQANKFCKEFVIDFAESNQALIKAQGTTNMQVQLLCATASATARIYNGMTVFTALQRKVDASTVSADFANVEEVLRNGILPSDYFSNAEFIDEIDDSEQAYAVFERDGDNVNLAGWTAKDDIATTTQLNDEITARENADLGLQGQIDDLKGLGRFLSVWNCVTGLAETNPPESPYTYNSGDYFLVGTVSTATPAVNYKPNGSSYTTGVPSTTVESGTVQVNDVYIYDGTTWQLQENSQRTVVFAGIQGDPYDNTALGNALDAKQDELTAGTDLEIVSGSPVPSVYQEVEYLIDDGASYIVTDYTPTPDSVVTTKTYVRNYGSVFGSRWSPSPTYDTFAIVKSSSGFSVYFGRYSDGYYKNITGALDTEYDVAFDITTATIGATTTNITREQFTATQKLYIGALNNNGTAGSILQGRIYRLTITENGVIVADFIPCKRIADSVLGMYETVSGTFLTNAGTGTFTAGADISSSTGLVINFTNDSGYITSSDIPVTDVTVGGTSVVSSGVAAVPAIPTVNDATITITQGGVTKGSFTLNQASGDTIALDAGGGSTAIDNSTITKNLSDELQAVATVNANTAAGATNPLYDWVGTLAEYTAQDIENTHPDWLCFITDDTTAQAYDAYSKTQSDSLFVGKGHEVIAFQAPTAGNNYTWYRKYADGWVEQGGIATIPSRTNSGSSSISVVFPVTMTDTNYTGQLSFQNGGAYYANCGLTIKNRQTTGVGLEFYMNASGTTAAFLVGWEVKGMAA